MGQHVLLFFFVIYTAGRFNYILLV